MRLCRFEKRKCHKICMRIVAVPFCKLRTMWRRIVWKAINFIFEIGRTDSVFFFCSSIFVSVEFATAQNALVILCDRAMGRTKIDFSIWILLIWQTKCSKIKVLILLYCLRERKKYGNFVFSASMNFPWWRNDIRLLDCHVVGVDVVFCFAEFTVDDCNVCFGEKSWTFLEHFHHSYDIRKIQK